MPNQKTLAVVQAYDGEFIAELELQDWTAVDAMLDRAFRLHADRNAWLPAHQRREILQKLAGLMQAEAEDFAGGIPHTMADMSPEKLVVIKEEINPVAKRREQ